MILGNPLTLRSAGKDAFSFLLLTPSPRAAGIGESFCSVADGAETVAYNPAGLAFQNKSSIFLQSYIPPYLENTKYNNLIFLHNLKSGAFAFHTGILQVSGLPRTTALSSVADGFVQTDDFSIYDLKLAFSGGLKIRNFEDFGVGGTFSFLRESLSDVSANGLAFDFGAIYRDPNQPFQAGLSIQNCGPKVKFKDDSFSLPLLARIGGSIMMPEDSSSFVPERTLLSADLVQPFDGELGIRGGLELPIKNIIFLRSGYSYVSKNQELGSKSALVRGLTMGIGFQFSSIQFDYALQSFGELGLVHNIAVNFRFGRTRESMELEEKYSTKSVTENLNDEKTKDRSKETVAFLNLSAVATDGNNAMTASRNIRKAFEKRNRFSIVPEREINQYFRKMYISTCDGIRCSVMAGRELRATKVVIGTITETNGLFLLHIRIVDVNTEQEEYQDEIKLFSLEKDDMKTSSDLLVDRICNFIARSSSSKTKEEPK